MRTDPMSFRPNREALATRLGVMWNLVLGCRCWGRAGLTALGKDVQFSELLHRIL